MFALAGTALQSGVDVEIDLTGALGGGALGVAVTTLVFGALLVALAPAYTTARMRDVVERPWDTFAYGIFVLLALVVMTVALVISIVGILVAVPLLVAAYLTWAFGSAVAFLALADLLLERFEDGGTAGTAPEATHDGAGGEKGDAGAVPGTDRDTDGDIDWAKAILVAALLDGALVLTGVGTILALCIGAAGFGAVVQDWLE